MVTPPYTLNFREMTSVGSTMLMTTITVNDITVTNLPVKFHIKLTSPGITIENIATAAVTSMEFYGGESRILMGSDLAQYFQLNNLVFNGYSKEKYQKTGQIPGGVWKLTIEARHFYTGRLLSNVGSFTFWVSVYDPPVLVSPANGVEAPSNPSLPMVLSWQASKHTGGTAPIQYTVKVWEMLAAGVPAQTVAQSGNPIYTATTTAQSHTLVTTGVPMKPSVHYCWQVVVSDPSNMAIINDEGKSEVREFTYMSTCPDVDEIQARVKGTQVDFMWDPTPRHDHFEVELLQEGGSSSVLTSYDDHFSYYDFERGTTWKVRIKGYCPGGLSSDYSAWTNFSIPQAIQPPTDDECPDCGCDDVDSRTITNFETMELTAGDTIKNRTGRTRFIIVNATPNGDGSYNGNFLLWMELWKVKFLCEYTNLKVNTDGVIVAGQWASVYNPALLGDPAQIAQFVNDLKGNIAAATYNNTIRDTIALAGGSFQTIYINSDGQYMAVKADGTEVDVTKQLDEAHRTLVTDDEGHQMVVTDNGSVMSVEQYKATGSNKTLISESNAAKDKQVSTGKVTFAKADGQKYGFDAYSADNAYDAVYPALEGGYRPAYKSIAKWQSDVVTASPMENVSFRNQMGAPYAVKNGTIELRGDATPGESPVYAHVAETDSTTKVVGKLNLLTFDEKQVQLCLVPVNGARLPNASELQAELNSIFAPAVASVTVTTHSGLTMAYANGQNFVHGGSGWLSVYNADQKAAIQALTDAQDDVYYLFFVDNATKLDENDKPTIVAGYMPVCRRYGFIYDNPTSKYVAHEVSHGAFSLHHTFSSESESYYAPQGTTPNLMDYSGGTALNHLQWQWMHESHTNLLGFLDDEGESEFSLFKSYLSLVHYLWPLGNEVFDVISLKEKTNLFFLPQLKTSVTLCAKQQKNELEDVNVNWSIANEAKNSNKLTFVADDIFFGEKQQIQLDVTEKVLLGNDVTLTYYISRIDVDIKEITTTYLNELINLKINFIITQKHLEEIEPQADDISMTNIDDYISRGLSQYFVEIVGDFDKWENWSKELCKLYEYDAIMNTYGDGLFEKLVEKAEEIVSEDSLINAFVENVTSAMSLVNPIVSEQDGTNATFLQGESGIKAQYIDQIKKITIETLKKKVELEK